MTNAEQLAYWNGEAGKRWARDDNVMEQLLRPVTELLLAHINTEGCRNAIDVGCGGGSQSIMLADQLGAGASVLGIDISEPMLEVARSKVSEHQPGRATVEFRQADAAVAPFEPAEFDLMFSRFGVMFFDDPTAAFGNLRTAMSPGAQLAFCCWQPLQANDWTWIPLQAALRHLPPPPSPEPGAPGPFAFADPARVRSILTDSGFADITLKPQPITLSFGHAGSLAESVRELTRIGPISRLLDDRDDAALEPILDSIEEALAPNYRDGALQMPGAVWLVTASVSQ